MKKMKLKEEKKISYILVGGNLGCEEVAVQVHVLNERPKDDFSKRKAFVCIKYATSGNLFVDESPISGAEDILWSPPVGDVGCNGC